MFIIDNKTLLEGNLEQELMSEEEFDKEKEQEELENLTFKESFYTTEKMVADNHYTPPKNANKSLYIILTRTNTIIGRAINKVMGTEYNHTSLSFDKTFYNAYSFARLGKGDSIFRSGFRKEDFSVQGYNGGYYCILELPVTEKQYKKALLVVKEFEKNKDKYDFDRLGLVLAGLNIPLYDRYKFFCSKFVDYVLKSSGIKLFSKDYALVRPNDFLINSALTKVEEGNIDDKLSNKNINETNDILDESKLSKDERDNIPDEQFGVPEKRQFPLIDKEHVQKAMQLFNKCEEKYKRELSLNIKRRAEELGLGMNISADYYKYTEAVSLNEDFNFYLSEARRLNTFIYNKLLESGFSDKLFLIRDYYNNIKTIKSYKENNNNLSEYKIFYFGLRDENDIKKPDNTYTDFNLDEIEQGKRLSDYINNLKDEIFSNFNNSVKEINISNNGDIEIKCNSFNYLQENGLVLNEASKNISTKRKEIESMVYHVMNILDKSGENTKKYKDFYSKMTDEQFDKHIKSFLKDEDNNFFLETLPNKNEPSLKDIEAALDYLKIPKEEYVYFRHDGHKDNPIRTREKVCVGILNVRRLQQILSKKNTYSLDIDSRSAKTGQVSGHDKIA